jgi:hypothetical protein
MKKPISANIKISLVVIAVFIIIGLLWYTQSIVEKLQEREREIVSLFAKTTEYIANVDPDMNYDLTFFLEIIQGKSLVIDFPIILCDSSGTPESYRNITFDPSLDEQGKNDYLNKLIVEMDKVNQPIYNRYKNKIIQSVHYDESSLIKQLKWLPIIEISIGVIFILIGYLGFSYIKKSEHGSIWVGMSKETAHQLGTPLSSISGWVELLKMNENLDAKARETISEMDNDLQRLNKVASRFSKIGSIPELRSENLEVVINKVMKYFAKRIPQMEKKVEISIIKSENIPYIASINSELFEWVLENLIKNALDSFENNIGKITITLSELRNNFCIDVADTGKGIDQKYTKDVFRPGFSTKKRGWGLGLSLSRRIIEDYHKGKIFIKETIPDKGTTFRIKIKK